MKFEKNTRILTDLMGYCHHLGANHFEVKFDMVPESTQITLRAKLAKVSPEILEELETALNIPRQKDVEQSYWSVGGGEELDAEIPLVGMMVDTAGISHENGVLEITVQRLHYSAKE